LGWPGYKVYQAEIDEQGKRLKLWVRRKRGNKQDAVSDACESAAARRVARQFGLLTSTVVVSSMGPTSPYPALFTSASRRQRC